MFISDTTCGGKSVRPGQQSAIKLKFNCATKVAALLTAVASICIDTAVVHATRKQKHDDRDSICYYGPAGPNVSYRSGPHTRILCNQALLAGCRQRSLSRRSQVH